MSAAPWQVWIDTGGTFTDCVALDPRGDLHRCKVLSSSALRATVAGREGSDRLLLRFSQTMPEGVLRGLRVGRMDDPRRMEVTADEGRGSHGDLVTVRLEREIPVGFSPGAAVELASSEEAPLLAARMITATPLGDELPTMSLRLATTRGTNALLQRRGAACALFITRGLGDLLEIGTQQRPDLFALRIERSRPIYSEVVEVDERVSADGAVLADLDLESLRARVRQLVRNGVTSAAVALLHGYRSPAHEERLEAFLREHGFTHVSRSSGLAPFIGLLTRARTATVDAYLAPVIASYLDHIGRGLGGGQRLMVMTSAGGLVGAESYHPKDSLLSGPAAGVVGAAEVGRRALAERLISFDMGGTSTDVARYDGDLEYAFEHEVGGIELAAPSVAIESVAAGGGSICSAADGVLRVGPESAGADPGPAAYGKRGPLTITDANLLLGRLDAARFPIPIDLAAARRRLSELVAELALESDQPAVKEGILEGLIRIADEKMADAIRRISVRLGYDPAEYALVAFGGAGGQHACAVAELLSMNRVLMPADAGLLSAVGLGRASIERFAERQILARLDTIETEVDRWLVELGDDASRRVEAEGIERSAVEIRRRILELRYMGQDSCLSIERNDTRSIAQQFERRYEEVFSHRPTGRPIEVVSARVVASSIDEGTEVIGDDRRRDRSGPGAAPIVGPEGTARARCYLEGHWHEIPLHERDAIGEGDTISGPALVQQEHSALVVGTRWRAVCLPDGTLDLSMATGSRSSASIDRPTAVKAELMRHRFESVAKETGEMLRRTAVSTNVKERQDFSCAVLDPEGRLVVNAPHIPVHLGALGLCVRRLVEALPLQSGDVVMTNHPAFGGSHLPDITVVTPVDDADGRRLGYVASRAHHAELGGIRPGSMPTDARNLAEEAVVIPPTHVIRGGEPRWDEVERILCEAPFPTRGLTDNLSDLRAMVAANSRGASALVELASLEGAETLRHHMDELRHRSAHQVDRALDSLPDRELVATESMDDGSLLSVSLRARAAASGDAPRLRIDFTGSAPVHPGNLNATPAVVRSAVMYVLRLLIEEELPLNEGLLDPVELIVPEGMLSPAFPEDPALCPAVVGGNVETSQRLVDALLKALGSVACSQGTMNNLCFGDESFGYYETLGGGSGAGPGFDGAGGVHCHMTNTRITDPEVLEHRYPVRLHRFALRRNSGGAGRWRGGDGLVREIEFLAPLSLALLTEHRVVRPYGVDGGGQGMPGRQILIRSGGGGGETLESSVSREVGAGDRLILETPGGGGWGDPATQADGAATIGETV